MSFWYRLDNAAKIFPPAANNRRTTVFRLGAILKETVHADCLQQALVLTIKRYPYFKVQLKSGFFWYYFEENRQTPTVEKETSSPCRPLKLKKKGAFPFRVQAYFNRISVEFFHALTDGTGALEFLKTLLAAYLSLKGTDIPKSDLIKHWDDPVHEAESDDSFLQNYDKHLPHPPAAVRSYQLTYRFLKRKQYRILTGIVPVKKLIERAKEFNGATITQFLTAHYIYSFSRIQEEQIKLGQLKRKHARPICIQVPVNLRKMLHSKSMKNFFLTVNPAIDQRLGKFEFEEILKKVKNFLEVEIDEKYIRQQISRNVKNEKKIINRLIPLFIKNIVLGMIYDFEGDKKATSSLSNLGKITLPKEMSNKIERFEFYPPPNPIARINCTVISFKDNAYISFGRVAEMREVERLFFTQLVSQGIPVKVDE